MLVVPLVHILLWIVFIIAFEFVIPSHSLNFRVMTLRHSFIIIKNSRLAVRIMIMRLPAGTVRHLIQLVTASFLGVVIRLSLNIHLLNLSLILTRQIISVLIISLIRRCLL